jgi:hypothetical protein
MMDERHKAAWRVIGKSIQGASHMRMELPNQDAIRWLPNFGLGPPLIVAVADGHGSAQYFRSNEGARLAVETATEVLQHFLDGRPDLSHLPAIKRTAEERLPELVVRAWREAVDTHVEQHPFTEEEWVHLVKEKGQGAQHTVAKDPILAYGATLLTVLVTDAFILYMQLGDGDILIVSEQGEVTRPLKGDERLIANETTSLCLPRAWNDFRMEFQPLLGLPPSQTPTLILLSTDGYANSFPNEAGFFQVGSDLLAMIRSQGLDAVNAQLEEFLTRTSHSGSGDDITLGIVRRIEEEPSNSPPSTEVVSDREPENRSDDEVSIDQQASREKDFRHGLQEIQVKTKEISTRVFILLLGVAVASCLAVAALTLSLILWSRPVVQPMGQAGASPPSGRPDSRSLSQTPNNLPLPEEIPE